MKRFGIPTALRRTQIATKPPFALQFRGSKGFIYASVSIAVFTDLFLYGVIVPVMPYALHTRAGVPEGEVQHWVSVLLAVYGAALLAASPITGYVADHTSSRRLPLLVGLLALASSTVMLCVGSSIRIFVIGRIFQGFSAAVVWSVGLALIVDTANKDEVGQALGYVGMGMSTGIVLAPMLGGVVFDRAGYVAVFAMAFGLIGVDVVLRLAIIEKQFVVKWLGNGGSSSCHSSDGMGLEVQNSQEQAQQPPQQPQNSLSTTITPLNESSDLRAAQEKESNCLAESNIPISVGQPPLRSTSISLSTAAASRTPSYLTLLTSPRLLAALWGSFVQSILLTSFDAVLPLFVKTTFGWPSINAGLIFLPLVVPSLISPLVGWAADKYGPRWLSTAGLILAVPFFVLLRLITHDAMTQKVVLCILLVGVGTSLTLIMTPLIAEITYALEAMERASPGLFGKKGAYAQAYSLFNIAFAGGCVIGPIWAGLVRKSDGWGTMAWSLAILAGITIFPNMIWVGGRLGKRSESTSTAIEEQVGAVENQRHVAAT